MNGEFYNPDSWMDIVDHLWIGLVFILVAGVPSWLAARNHTTIKAIKNQVVNGHEQPLRADLDRAIEAIESLARDVLGLSHNVGNLRKDLSSEEDRRRVQIDELRDDVDRMRRRP